MKRISLVAAVAALALMVTATAALAREVYVPDYNADGVYVLDAATGQQIGPVVATGTDSSPYTLAIAPDGKTVYVTSEGKDRVEVIDTATKAVVGSIPVGDSPFGIAISADGSRAYVSNSGSGSQTLSAIDLATRQTIGAPIPVGKDAYGVAVTPDGSRVFVVSSGDDNVTVIDAVTLQTIGAPIPVGDNPYGLAITPDGARVLVANNDDNSVSVIDAKTLQTIGAPIPVGDDPSGVTVSPSGQTAYVGNYGSESVSVIDLAANQAITTIPGLFGAEFIALTPSGRAGFVSTDAGTAGINPATNAPSGSLAPMGGAGQLAVVPDQAPVAALNPPKRIRPGVAAKFSGAGSGDSDGSVATYTWSFAGGAPQAAGATASHTFAKPGKYAVGLTVTDDEGCSVATAFTGQTAYCNGNPAAAIAKTITVAFPGVKAKRCPKHANRGCRVIIQAVGWKGKGKKRRLVPQSAPAKAKLKAGSTKILSLKPKKKARKSLAQAKRILVIEAYAELAVGSEPVVSVRFVKLKVVR